MKVTRLVQSEVPQELQTNEDFEYYRVNNSIIMYNRITGEMIIPDNVEYTDEEFMEIMTSVEDRFHAVFRDTGHFQQEVKLLDDDYIRKRVRRKYRNLFIKAVSVAFAIALIHSLWLWALSL